MSRSRNRVAVTGLGVISAVGGSVPEFWENLVRGQSGVRRLPWREDTVAASVDFDPEMHFSRLQLSSLDRFAQLGLLAVEQAVMEAGVRERDLAGPRAGVYFGSGIGGAESIESTYRAFLDPSGRVSPMNVVLAMANAAAAHVSLRYAIRGPTLTYSVACASAAVAIGEAFRAIRDGYIDVAIAGGAEAMLVPGAVASWKAMRVLATPDASHPEQSCRPFSADRNGLVLGEGAGALILESFDHAKGRGHESLAEVVGYGLSSDATHLARPDATGQVAAMRASLADSGLEPSAIGYINAHGTATPVGDVSKRNQSEKRSAPRPTAWRFHPRRHCMDIF